MARDLGDVALLSWVVTANLITGISATALAGKLSDIHGRRPLILAALTIFMAASCVCALAQLIAAPSLLVSVYTMFDGVNENGAPV